MKISIPLLLQKTLQAFSLLPFMSSISFIALCLLATFSLTAAEAQFEVRSSPAKPHVQIAKTCWKSEINPQTQQIYASKIAWQKTLNRWIEFKPEPPNPIELVSAFSIYQVEKQRSLNYQNDKVTHCYMGCRIYQKTSLSTLKYVAWLKEYQDLTDCRPQSHYEPTDYNATIWGAKVDNNSAKACENLCQLRWAP